jgi:hypothetical protein
MTDTAPDMSGPASVDTPVVTGPASVDAPDMIGSASVDAPDMIGSASGNTPDIGSLCQMLEYAGVLRGLAIRFEEVRPEGASLQIMDRMVVVG